MISIEDERLVCLMELSSQLGGRKGKEEGELAEHNYSLRTVIQSTAEYGMSCK